MTASQGITAFKGVGHSTVAGPPKASPHHGMHLSTSSPVPAMVTQSLVPYMHTGADCLTPLPTEVMQRIASNLNPDSIRALRGTNKAAYSKTFFNFATSCLHTLNIETSKVGFRRGLRNLQIQFANVATTQVTFTLPAAVSEHRRGYRSNSKVIVPSRGDVDRMLEQMQNVTSIVVRHNSKQRIAPNTLFSALIVAPRTNLTDLTLDGCAISGKMLTSLLTAHRATLRYLVLRDVESTDGKFVLGLLGMIRSDFSLTRLVIDFCCEDKGSKAAPFTVVPKHYLRTVVVNYDGFKELAVVPVNDVYLMEHMASLTGHFGVPEGIAFIQSYHL